MAAKLPSTEYPDLQKFVMKGITTKASAHDALDQLRELIDALEEQHGEFDNALSMWEDEDDKEVRAEGRELLEEIVTSLDEPLANAGYCAGQEPYDPPDV